MTYGKAVLGVQEFADDYVDGYEFRGEDDEGREGFHKPTPEEDILIRDAINGLIADEDFVTLIGTEYLERQKLRAAEGACLECGAPPPQHWGTRCTAPRSRHVPPVR